MTIFFSLKTVFLSFLFVSYDLKNFSNDCDNDSICTRQGLKFLLSHVLDLLDNYGFEMCQIFVPNCFAFDRMSGNQLKGTNIAIY